MGLIKRVVEKLNPGQERIRDDQGHGGQPTTQTKLLNTEKAYELVEVVGRSVNLTVDNISMIDYTIGDSLGFTGVVPNMQGKRLHKLLNERPNPYMDINTFRRLSFMDFLIDGNTFWYYDGHNLYHLPARLVEVVPDEKTYVNKYIFDGDMTFLPNEIIHIPDNSIKSVYRGDSRILSCMQSLYTRESMLDFQKAFFKSGTAVGLVVETETILGKKLRERRELEWKKKFNPRSNNGAPLFLDGGQKAKTLTNSNFRELAFIDSIKEAERRVNIALGIPPILLDSGNNANLKPNLELWFYTTLIPIMRRYESSLEQFFGIRVELSTYRVPALIPDREKEAKRLVSLKNNGIITGNEARDVLKMKRIEDPSMDKIHHPSNVAGSAAGNENGGRPEDDEDDNDED